MISFVEIRHLLAKILYTDMRQTVRLRAVTNKFNLVILCVCEQHRQLLSEYRYGNKFVMFCNWCYQKSGVNADKWASSICSKLEAASHSAPRGKHARHADMIQLVHISSSSVDSVLNSVKELAVMGQLSSSGRENSSASSVIKNSQSTVL